MFIKDESIDVLNLAEFKNLSIPYRRVNLLGKYKPGDNLGGEYFFDENSTQSPNDITIVKLNNTDTGRYERITTSLAGLVSTAEQIDREILAPYGYCSYVSNADLQLTNTFQVVKNFNEIVSPLNVEYDNSTGNFKSLVNGIWRFSLERIYLNYDQAPTQPIILWIEMRKNNDIFFERNAIIGSATQSNEPSTYPVTTDTIIPVQANDVFNFRVRATMNSATPLNTKLALMQISAHRLHNLIN